MPKHSHEHREPSNKAKFRSLSWPLRRETIRALPRDKRWTREACVEHWAAGIDTVAIAKLADKRIFLAMNLRDNEQVFDHLQGELLLLADYLGPSRLYISIYESGSSDGTPQKLRAFQQDLNLLRIPNTIITDGVGKRPDQTRIEFLANARNIALAPLLKQVWDGPYGNPYAGTYYHGNGCCEPLTAIEVFGTGSKVFGIQFSYGGVQKGRMGSPTGERFELRLEKDEVVTCVEGAGKEWLTKLVVRTNRGAVLAVGEVDSDGWRGEGSKLDDVSGFASGDAIHALSFAWSGGLLTGERRFDRVVILNDGYLCVEDIILLLMHEATVATAVDTIGLREEEHTRSLMVYDSWVGRDIDGREQERKFPLSNIPQVRQWFSQGKPIPVFCACHGGANIDAHAFYEKRITFRNRGWEGECAASEYSLLCKDIWRAYGNGTKIVMDPRVVVGVDQPAWEHVVLARSKKVPASFHEPPFDVGIKPSPWEALPAVDRSLVEDTLAHMRGFVYPVPRHVTCAPIHHDSPREAALIGRYDEELDGVPVYPRGPWEKNPECAIEADAYTSRYAEPGKTMFYFNSAGHQQVHQKRLYIGGGDRLVSPDFRYMLLFQQDRSCILYFMTTAPFQPVWKWPMCDDPSILYIEFQGDGNLVAYADNGVPVHATGTTTEPRKAEHMALENDGRLVLRTEGGELLWEADRGFLTEGSDWEREDPGWQIFIPITLQGGESEIEAATAVGELCRALTGRVYFSLVTLKDASLGASQSVMQGVLLEYMCSYKMSGMAVTRGQAQELHVASYEELTTGHAHSCAKAFPLGASDICVREFVDELRGAMSSPQMLGPCTGVHMDSRTDMAVCCNLPIPTS